MIDPAVPPTATTDGLTEGSHCSECGEILVAQDKIPAELSGVKIASLTLKQEGNNLSATLKNSVTEFSFFDDIKVDDSASYIVAKDTYCENVIHSKIAPLVEGDNVFYILVTNGTDMQKYTVTIRRLPMYTVSFNTDGGTAVESQKVEEGSLVAEPTAPTKGGYVFVGWDYDFENPITANVTVSAKWQANPNTTYKVEYYLENLTKTAYDLDHTDTLEGTTDTTAEAVIKSFNHFTYNTKMSMVSGNVNGDGSLVLKVYYTRDTYQISINISEASTLTGGGTYAYGNSATVSLSSTNPDYRFLGWYSGDELISSETTYTAVIDRNIEARFEMLSEMQSFNFTSTATTCTITGIKDKTVTEIIVPDYVTSISQGAFSGCSKLTSITIPFVGGSKSATTASSSTLFGYIFGTSSYTGGVSTTQYYNSSSSATYYIPSSLESVTVTGGNILYGAFCNCDSLTSVSIGDSVTSIGDYAFYDCDSLTSVSIGDSVTSICSAAFRGCYSLNAVYISDIAAWCNIRFGDYDTNPLYYADNLYLNGELITELIIPEGVAIVPQYAFSCNHITSVVVPDSVTSIGYYAFRDCYSLKSVVIPDSVTSIGQGAFSGCFSLESITLPFIGATKDGTSYTHFGYIFGASKSGDNDDYVPSSLKTVIIGDSVTSIGDKAFYNCSSLTSVSIGDSVTSIGDYAFYKCTSLTSVVIGDSVTSIGKEAFYSCSSLTSVVIGDSVTSIGSYAFYDCTSLTSVSIGDSVTSIGDEAFRFCSKLVEVYNLSSLDITKGSYAYGWVGYYALNVYTSLEEKSRLHTTTDGFVFYEDGNKCYLVGYIGNKTDITLPESYNGKNYEIYWFAFAYCDNLTSVSIGDGVTSIGEGAFARCSSLKSVSIGDSVTSIGSDAFYDCDSLTSVSIGDSVTSIGLQAFYNCSSLTSVKYRGTEAQWNAITKGTYWNNNTGNYTITYNYKGD